VERLTSVDDDLHWLMFLGCIVHTVLSGDMQTKISSLELFPGHAEITRILPVSLEQGLNQVVISGLPNDLMLDTLMLALLSRTHPWIS
jgi:hypothetical protein